jgi:hypothetical protein
MDLNKLTWGEKTAINVKIADFLKWEKSTRYANGYLAFNRDEYQVMPEELKFHISWDWLNTAIEGIEEKIVFYNAGYKHENVEFIQSFEDMLHKISNGLIIKKSKVFAATDLEVVLDAVIIFIDWYNKL